MKMEAAALLRRTGSMKMHAENSGEQTLKVSLIVACRNESKHVRSFLDSVLAQDLEGFDWQIIIADGMSDDGTREILQKCSEQNSRVVTVDNPKKIVSTGLNAAIHAASGEIILRMDAHTEYAPNYVKKCIEALRTTGADNVGGPARTKADGLWARAIQAAYHSRFSTGGASFHDDGYSGYVDTVTYGCWRKATLVKLGLFDERLVRNQDDELNLRITRTGGKIWQSSEIMSWYRPRASLSALFRQYFQYGFWKVAVIRKHRIPGAVRHLVPGMFVAGNFALLLGSLLAASGGFRDLSLTLLLGWGTIMAAYCVATVVASLAAARKFGTVLLPLLPITFLVFHLSYGLGFLAGSTYWTLARSVSGRLSDLFVGVTR
jgi:succinoglycan biosynthesis protein ExoA